MSNGFVPVAFFAVMTLWALTAVLAAVLFVLG
jgi:hypothetical protein